MTESTADRLAVFCRIRSSLDGVYVSWDIYNLSLTGINTQGIQLLNL